MAVITIIHISDLHFGSNELVYTHSELNSGLHSFLSVVKDEKPYVLITGDITFQGRPHGYNEAEQFMRRYLEDNLLTREKLLLCPGNHDIVKTSSDPFANFDAFSYALRLDNVFTYSDNNCVIYEDQNVVFLGINTAYRADHRYGAADVKKLQELLRTKTWPADKLKIAFLHHHLINQFEGDISVLRNAYGVLTVLDKYEFEYIVHGHQHSNQAMPIGESRMRIFGVRTFNFDTPGYPNGFNCYKITEDSIVVENYTFSRDVVREGE
jgi:3',5'-cyclic AMP phosphodiesterase CpdA